MRLQARFNFAIAHFLQALPERFAAQAHAGRFEQIIHAAKRAGVINHPQLPILVDQNVPLIAVGVVDQVVEDVHVFFLANPIHGARRVDFVLDAVALGHRFFNPNAYRAVAPG